MLKMKSTNQKNFNELLDWKKTNLKKEALFRVPKIKFAKG